MPLEDIGVENEGIPELVNPDGAKCARLPIIVVEEAAKRDVKISFGEFARAGIPVAVACMAVAAAWIATIAR